MNKHFVKYGLIAAGIAIIVVLILYVIDPKIMVMAMSYLTGITALTCCVLAAKSLKKEQGGVISFKDAFSESWKTYLIYAVIAAIFTFILHTFIDPNLKDVIKEIAIEGIEKAKGFMGEEAAEKMMEEIEVQDLASPLAILKDLGIWLLIYAVYSLIIGAVLKKEKPVDWDSKDNVDSGSDSNLA